MKTNYNAESIYYISPTKNQKSSVKTTKATSELFVKKKFYIIENQEENLSTKKLKEFAVQVSRDTEFTPNFIDIVDLLAFIKNRKAKDCVSNINFEKPSDNISLFRKSVEVYELSSKKIFSEIESFKNYIFSEERKKLLKEQIKDFENSVTNHYQLIISFCELFIIEESDMKLFRESFNEDLTKFAIYRQFISSITIEKENQLSEIRKIENLIENFSPSNKALIESTNIFESKSNSVSILKISRLSNSNSDLTL